jgi:hypothetical protein
MTTLDRLTQIIPPDQAVANKALAVSLQGITGIGALTLSRLATAAANVQTTTGLPLIAAQTSAVSPAAVTSILNSVGTGTGQNGTVQLNDILGTAVGYVSANALTTAVSTFTTMNLVALIDVYSTMANTVNGDYGDPITGPVVIPTGAASGTYSNAATAFDGESAGNVTGGLGLIPVSYSTISNVVAANPTQIATLNSSWANIMSQLALEKTTQAKADLDFALLTANSTSSIYSLVYSLPDYGQDTSVGGTAAFMQGVADLSNITGQAVIAVMRQGQTNLTSTGIASNAQVPAEPNPPIPPAPLLPAQPPYPAP